MISIAFVTFLMCFCLSLIVFGFVYLPNENWQILASIPTSKSYGESWNGVNITWYGFFASSAYVISILIFLVLIGSIKIPLWVSLVYIFSVLIPTIPLSKKLTVLIEKKKNVFSTQAGLIIGMIIAPWLLMLFNLILKNNVNFTLPLLPIYASCMIAYAFGEGMGRLACLSYGCCYGKPIDELNPFLHKLFSKFNIVFHGDIKKSSYEGHLEGKKLVPVQVITSVLYVTVGLISIVFFLNHQFLAAFLLSLIVTQGWRYLSENLRADYRGDGKITAYQKFSIIAIVYSMVIIILGNFQSNTIINLELGIKTIFNPVLMIIMQIFWFTILIYMGKSKTTRSILSIMVEHGNQTC